MLELSDSRLVAQIERFDRACRSRNQRDAYAAMAAMCALQQPEQPVDIAKVRGITHVMAATAFGWEIEGDEA
jgi:hypothetical protein